MTWRSSGEADSGNGQAVGCELGGCRQSALTPWKCPPPGRKASASLGSGAETLRETLQAEVERSEIR